MRKAVLAGTFDPITKGHLDIIERTAVLYDELHVVIGTNPDKINSYAFSLEDRLEMVRNSISEEYNNIVVTEFKGLLCEYAYNNGIQTIVRGLRNPSDFEYELTIASVNRDIRDIETLFMPCKPEFFNVSSSVVKAIVKEDGSVEKYVPLAVKSRMEEVVSKFIVIGLAGMSGAGKSTFAQRLTGEIIGNREHENWWAKVIDMDHLTHKIYESKEPYALDVKNKMRMYFGEAIVDEELNVNRKLLARVVFGNNQELAVLNKLMENPLRHAIYEYIKNDNHMGRKMVYVLDGAIIPEAGLLPLVNNEIIYVECERHVALERIMDRDGITKEEADARLNSQDKRFAVKQFIKESINKDKFGKMMHVDTTDGNIEQSVKEIADYIFNNKTRM